MLAALLHGAHIICLPITQGSGSNLKTAEALLADSYIVGTTKAFRGFEFALDFDRVFISDSSKGFKEALYRCFSRKSASPSAQEKEMISDCVTWESALDNLSAIESLL
jgi:hypothetical protein